MNKILSRGKVLITYVSVLAILAVSVLSVFTGISFNAFAEDDATEEVPVITYPLNGSYDANVKILEGGISYSDIDTSKKTVVSEFTGFDKTFWLTAKGDGTAANPYIIETANQFAAVATGNLVDAKGDTISTEGVSFKVADNIKAFDMNNTTSTVDFSGDMTAEQVKAAFSEATVIKELDWNQKSKFMGRFDGNGVVIYGLMVNNKTNAGLFPEVNGNITIRNLTVKNCYFYGDAAAVVIAKNSTPSATVTIFQNCAIYNNVVISDRMNDAVVYGGILTAACSSDSTINISECLVYGNEAKHQGTHPDHGNTYDITYGLYGRFHGLKSATVTNSIILDCAPHTLYYGSNAFWNSTYTNVYTNMIGEKWSNVDYVNTGATKHTLTYEYKVNDDGTVTGSFDRATNDVSDNVNYKREFAAGTMIKVNAEDVLGVTSLDGIDSSKWTYNEDGYPTPKIYNVREYSAGTPWSGEVALFYSGGEGTKNSPYEINTAEELALMLLTAEQGQSFKLMSDIVINDTSADNWTDTAKQWFTSNDVPTFAGTLDGNGKTVSGIYYSGEQAGTYAGLIPVVGTSTEIRELTVKNSVLNGSDSSIIGAVAGSVTDNCSKVVKFNAVCIEDTVKFNGGAVTGGIIASIGYSSVYMNDCISETNGLFSEVTGQAAVKRSVSVGAYPFASQSFIKAENVYTDTEGLEIEGVTVVANADMIGEAAATAMSGLDFTNSWVTVAGDYPAPTGAVASSNGDIGEVWSGAVASNYARGTGTESDPFIIETAEQLALCVYDPVPGKPGDNVYYKLAADIYLNDVNGNLWSSKIGCNEWFTQRTTKSYATFNNITFDGDGHVVYGVYFDNTHGNEYVRAGLFPQVGVGTKIKNLGISEAYIVGCNDASMEDSMGALIGMLSSWQTSHLGITHDPHNNPGNRLIINTPEYQKLQPTIQNCFVDHTCYIAGRNTGGFIGSAGGTVLFENCVFTGTLKASADDTDNYYTGSFIGSSWSYGDTFINCLSLPQSCDRPAAGASNSAWRATEVHFVTEIRNTYYFSKAYENNNGYTKLSKPEMRQGELAKESMPGLDWENTIGDGGTWRVVEDGTPVLTVFAKHRTAEELEMFSDKAFAAPNVTITLVTGTPDIDLDPLVGSMYSKVHLPDLSGTRPGYEFTGWYAFSDYTLKYEYDTFIARDVVLYAGWESLGIIQNFEQYTDTIWDSDEDYWILNKPGAKGGYKSKYVRNGSKSMHLLGELPETADVLLNYEDMLEVGKNYTISFWVSTDKENNPATVLSLVHNSLPVYKDTAVATESMIVTKGLTVGEWVQYSYTFTAQTKWISLRATGGSSLYFDDVFIIPTDAQANGNVINLGTAGGSVSPNTGDAIPVAVLISAIMCCAVVVVITRKNLVEVIEE